jgi:hypothetical protein
MNVIFACLSHLPPSLMPIKVKQKDKDCQAYVSLFQNIQRSGGLSRVYLMIQWFGLHCVEE